MRRLLVIYRCWRRGHLLRTFSWANGKRQWLECYCGRRRHGDLPPHLQETP